MQITPDQAARLYAAALTFRDGADEARERMNAAGIFCPTDLLYGAALAGDVLREITAAQIDARPFLVQADPEEAKGQKEAPPEIPIWVTVPVLFTCVLLMAPGGPIMSMIAEKATGSPLAGLLAIIGTWSFAFLCGRHFIKHTKFF